MNLNVWETKENTRGLAKLDFVVSGKNINIQFNDLKTKTSDHKMLNFIMNLKDLEIKPNKFYIPNRELSKTLTMNSLMEKNKSLDETLKIFVKNRRKFKRLITKSIKQKRYKSPICELINHLNEDNEILMSIKGYWSDFWRKEESIRYTAFFEFSFNSLQKLEKKILNIKKHFIKKIFTLATT